MVVYENAIRAFIFSLSSMVCSLLASGVAGAGSSDMLVISEQAYRDKVKASWLGQMIGNFYGLSYEFKFIDEPGPDRFPYGYGAMLDRLEATDGAFSDDDTDIEYMYLLQMEAYGPEPSYRQLARAWTHHVRERVWAANRQALALMNAGYTPPLTGARYLNSEWFQIDPQLVNEIWAVTAPGMIDYATAKTHWAALITNDSFGTEPAIHYAAMYSAAFFETNIEALIDRGTASLPRGSRFASVVEHMKALHKKYPDNWQAARAEMAEAYAKRFSYNPDSWVAIDATLNGAAGILALLYGGGDFQRTLDMACAIGFDADNQAATMSGLLGIVGGIAAIPESLLYPLGRDRWKLPFNDRYINVSRYDLPDASVMDLAQRIADQGVKLILANGGQRIIQNDEAVLVVNPRASFLAPLDLPAVPALLGKEGVEFRFSLDPADQHMGAIFKISEGRLPEGVMLQGAELRGVPERAGRYSITVQATRAGIAVAQAYQFEILGENLALSASDVLASFLPSSLDSPLSLNTLRDGKQGLNAEGVPQGSTLYTPLNEGLPAVEYVGYRWRSMQTIAQLRYNPGYIQEDYGWAATLEVQYLDEADRWRKVQRLEVQPPLTYAHDKYSKGKYISHSITFKSIQTRAIRLIATSGGVDPDDQLRPRVYSLSVNELEVYGE